MKIEEYKDVIYKTVKFCGHEYVLEDKNILLNSIRISEIKDCSPIKMCTIFV